MSEETGSQASPSKQFVPVCAIGASAGGVTALQGLFRQLPSNLGLAYVVVLHLSPDQPSALSDILSGCTRMPVLQIQDGPTLKRDCVYVIPPDRELVIKGDSVTARPFSEPRGRRAPIDMFFRSIAAARGDGVAIVLSGAGADGTLGVQAIKEAGGVIMVQEPAEAGFPSMPQNAIASGAADFVAPLARLAERLAEVAQSKEAVRSLDMEGSANDLRRIVAFLRARTGHDFSSYKRATVMRRVLRRMQVCRTDTVAAYADYLAATPDEAKELFADLLISVTMFFRDARAFEALQRQAIKPIFDDFDPEKEENVRAWVVGCATGEEAYSLAMLLHEEADRRKVRAQFQIFASDLDDGALATAREGRYPRSIEADVSDERLARFFVNEGTHYRVRKELRESVLFATHSVLKEPPFMRLDLISCRNLLIYMERALQQQVCSIFRYGLKPGRFLFLGSAETADAAADLFAPLDRDARIYTARPQATHALPMLPQFSAPERFTGPDQPVLGRPERGDQPASLHVSALERVAPASALVDGAHNIVHLSPSAGRFILHSAGPVSNQLPAIVRPELRLDLRLALTRAVEGKEPSLTHPTIVVLDGERRRISMHVTPVPNGAQMGAQALVFFIDAGSAPDDEAAATSSDARPDEVRRLHAELKAAQEAIATSRAGHEASIQDLRATNEELQSINEEYRSTAEELETSKEELQSINEELHTVNAELKTKLASISVAHSDLQNLTDTTEIGTLFLDADLHIKMFTPPITELFNFTKSDLGRTITDFSHQLDYDGIVEDARQVARQLAPIEREIHSRQSRSYVMRMRPYRTIEDRIDGVVVTFFDITDRLQTEAALHESEARYRAMFQAMNEGYLLADVIFDEEGRAADIEYLEANPAATRMVGTDLTGRRLREVDPEYEEYWYETFGRVARNGESERSVLYAKPGDIWYDFHVSKVEPTQPESRRIAIRFFDASARVRAETALRESEAKYRALVSAGNNSFYRMSADWRLMYRLDSDTLAGTHEPIADWQTKYILAEDRIEVEAAIAEAIRTKSPFELEHRVRLADGTVGWVLSRAVPLIGSDGEIVEWSGVGSDVTSRKRAEAALRESEAFRRQIIDSSRDCVKILDREGLLLWVSDQGLRVLECDDIGCLIGRSWIDTWPEHMRATVAEAVAMAAAGAERRFSGWSPTLKGTDRYWDVIVTPLAGVDDAPERLLAVSRDLTEDRRAGEALRVSEERFHQLFAASPVPFMVLAPNAPDFTITAANDAYLAATLRTRENLIGRRLFDVFTDDPSRLGEKGSDALAVSLNRVLTTRRTDAMPRVRYDIVTPDGGFEPHWWLAINAPVLDAAGRVSTIIHQVTRVTELHYAEEAERQGQERQQVLVAELQHRTRNLMGVVRSVSDTTIRSSTNLEDFEGKFRDRLAALARVQGLLSRLAETDRVSFDELLRTELIAHGAVGRNERRIVMEGPAGVALRSSTVQTLAMAIHELATNAVKYGALGQEKARLDIRWSIGPADEEGRPRLTIDWRESGVRMTPAISKPPGSGQGRELIEQALPYQLGAETSFVLEPDGVHCVITIPISARTQEKGR